MTAGELIDFLYESNVRSDLSIEDLANEIDKMSVHLGEWIIAEDIGDCCYRCSNCGFIRDAYVLDVGKYCPNCGAKMYDLCGDCQEFSCDYCSNRRARMGK